MLSAPMLGCCLGGAALSEEVQQSAAGRSDPAQGQTAVNEPRPRRTGSPGPRAGRELHALRERQKLLGIYFLGEVVNVVFLVLLVVLNVVAKAVFDRLGELDRLDGISLLTLRLLFVASTLGVIGSFVVWDLWQTIRRMWRSDE